MVGFPNKQIDSGLKHPACLSYRLNPRKDGCSRGSSLVLTVFTTYVGLIWVGAFPRVPCSCAGILESLGWAEHFGLNLICIGIAAIGLKLEGGERRFEI